MRNRFLPCKSKTYFYVSLYYHYKKEKSHFSMDASIFKIFQLHLNTQICLYFRAQVDKIFVTFKKIPLCHTHVPPLNFPISLHSLPITPSHRHSYNLQQDYGVVLRKSSGALRQASIPTPHLFFLSSNQ
jgi:hypothetical protein